MNEEETVQNDENNDSEDDDCEEYFLQSTPGPYDIREKIRLANDELFEDFEAFNQIREQKVTFSENLVDYEPDFSSDDGYVQSPDILSVISDNENESEEITHQVEDNEFNLQNNIEDISDSKDEHDTFENITSDNIIICESVDNIDNIPEEEETIDECEEEIEDKCVIEEVEDEIEDISEEQFIEVVEIIQDESSPNEDSFSSSTVSSEGCPINPREEEDLNDSSKKPSIILDKINCRLHCLEKKEIEFLNGKPKNYDDYLKGPVLKLRQRSCCTNQPFKPKLPVYNGFISEYGLTKSQLERKQRRKEKNVQKKKEKSVRVNEEKKQKDMYNEEIFCAWLKSLKNRNQANNNNNKENTVKKQRPKTAPLPHCNLSIAINKPKIKRPSTTTGCTFKILFE